jgi:hypothetical protein
MRSLRTFTVLTSLAVGSLSSAFAGVTGTLSGSVTPLGGATNVTYSIQSPKAMDTYVGYRFSLANTGGTATATNASLTVTATASDPAEAVKLLLNADVVLPAGCTKTSDSSFTCSVGQLKAGQSFPTFQAFFRAPTKVVNGQFDDLDPNNDADNDYVNVNMAWNYAERTNDQKPNTNSSGSASDASVLLGTVNPTKVISVVPKSGASLYTGRDGIPTSDASDKKQAMLATIPRLAGTTTFAIADLDVSFATDNLNDPDVACLNLGHFNQCPNFTVSIPNQTFPVAPWFTAIYRIDASSLKMAPNKILNSVQIKYIDDSNVEHDVPAAPSCTTPRADGVPCVVSAKCYKNNVQPVELRGDCEWTLINTRNGLTRFR